jgi:hypothetical protein
MGNLKCPKDGEKSKEKRPKKGDKMSDMTLAIREFIEISK